MAKVNIFDRSDFWEKYGLTPDYVERINIICDLVPDDVKTLLDIGCGKGEIINTLHHQSNSITIVGVDLFAKALDYVKGPAIQARLPGLPFRDKSFDLVLCLQVLEHINEAEYLASLQELQRLANRFLIIGVPFKENLLTNQVLCANCGKISNADGHLRRYNHNDIHNLFTDFALEKKILAGVLRRRRLKISTWMAQKVAGVYHKPEIFNCPYCGHNRTADQKRPFIIKITVVILIAILTRLKKPEPYWIIALYRKKHGQAG